MGADDLAGEGTRLRNGVQRLQELRDVLMVTDQDLDWRAQPVAETIPHVSGITERMLAAPGFDLQPDLLADAQKQGVFVGEMPVERHRRHPEPGGKAAHGHGFQTLAVRDRQRQPEGCLRIDPPWPALADAIFPAGVPTLHPASILCLRRMLTM